MVTDPSHPSGSALRERMIEDMTVRGFTEDTRRDYIRCVKRFAAFIGRSPDTAAAEDLRRFQVHQTQSGLQPPGCATSAWQRRLWRAVSRRGLRLVCPAVPAARLPVADASGRTVWVTRARPKIDRIACPWLIRRFVDPNAVFLFVAPQEVEAVAERFNAAPFDIEGEFWSHGGELCTFDVMVEEFGISTEPLQRLARIVRGADTARLDLEPQAHGMLAASLGLSRMFSDDLEQLKAGMTLSATDVGASDGSTSTLQLPPPRSVKRVPRSGLAKTR